MRFALLFGVLVALTAVAASAVGPDDGREPWNVEPLKGAFKGKFLIGTALDFPATTDSASIDVAIAMRHFNAST